MDGKQLKNQGVKTFTEAEIKKATDNFDDTRKIGVGRLGSVYKGMMPEAVVDRTAMKRGQHADQELPTNLENSLVPVTIMKAEVVLVSRVGPQFQDDIRFLSQINHKNVVKLLGVCLDTKVPILVFEYISKGSLYDHIYHMADSDILGSWKNRLKIAGETASALQYIHSLANPPVIHGDFKPKNILIDYHNAVKISFFDISLLNCPRKTPGLIGRAKRDPAYLDPEYRLTDTLTTKSDVYSFGVILMELLTGLKPGVIVTPSGEKMNAVQSFLSAVETKTISHMINLENVNEDEMKEIEVIADIAVNCLNFSIARPEMKDVAQTLLIKFFFRTSGTNKYFKRNGGQKLMNQGVKILTEAQIKKATTTFDETPESGESSLRSGVEAKLFSHMINLENIDEDEMEKTEVVASITKNSLNYCRAMRPNIKVEVEPLLRKNSFCRNFGKYFKRNRGHIYGLKIFTKAQIKKATQNFSQKIGEGGYSWVYRGAMPEADINPIALKKREDVDLVPVAIKVFRKRMQGDEDFVNEIVMTGMIHHVNVIRLIGFCIKGKQALVFHLMPNESLDKYIFSKVKGTLLNCKKIYEISLGIARGIEHLHGRYNMQVIHYDIKPHNILLDENLTPKICDFTFAKPYPTNDNIVSLSCTKGTLGYMAPELFYKDIGGVSSKVDVYGFGILLLELVGRRKNVDAYAAHSSQLYLPLWIYEQLNKIEQVDFKEVIKLNEVTEEERDITMKILIVALWCVQLNPSHRPSMKIVINMLEGDINELKLPPKPLLYPRNSTLAVEDEETEERMQTCLSSSSAPIISTGLQLEETSELWDASTL